MRDLQDHIALDYTAYAPSEMLERSRAFYQEMARRRTVRTFSPEPIDPAVIDNIVATAGTAPSGANKQPWTYCVVTSPDIKRQIRLSAEKEEFENYHGRMSDTWMDDLKQFGTDHIKEFLEEAPVLIVVFKRAYEYDDAEENTKLNNYYVNESVGLSVGLLLAGLQHAGLVAVTHTPSPMKFLAQVLDRPDNERAFLLIPVGYPKAGAVVPDIKRKPLEEIRVNYD